MTTARNGSVAGTRARFSDSVVLITAAARGIGRACCETMAAEGASIMAVDRNADALRDLQAALLQTGARVETDSINVLDEASVQHCVARTLKLFGHIDVLVNGVGGSTAGGQSTACLTELSLQDFDALVRLNLDGTFLFCRSVVPAMVSQRRGSIVNISSIAARGTAFSNAAYSAAKAGVVALTTKLALEIAPHGVRCNAVAPGLTVTERMQSVLDCSSREELARRAAQVPLGRFATAQDQANAICFLASEEAAFVTGTTLWVTGGI